jgi:hypothetical protein
MAIARVGEPSTGHVDGKISFMPVAHDYFERRRGVHVERLSRSGLRAMNEAMSRQSMMIAGRSDALVRSLSRLDYALPADFAKTDHLAGAR